MLSSHGQTLVASAEQALKEADAREIAKKKQAKLKKKNSKVEADEVFVIVCHETLSYA